MVRTLRRAGVEGTEGRRGTEGLLYRVVGAALHVHSRLGPGLLESVYERCLAVELAAMGIRVNRQVAVPLTWREVKLAEAFRADLVVEDRLLLEIKAVEAIAPIHKAQVLTYLRLSGLHRGLLLNFNVVHLRDGMARVTNFAALAHDARRAGEEDTE
ncbi:MAG: GxxExxY protein [Gemmatimonadaceae bacterium]|nr:GxxExxY protein [Gemmatimonadaceae bacterium]